jgi:hypothetical protein
MRDDWKQAPPQIRGEIMGKLRELGPYSAAMHAMGLGFAVTEIEAWCPAHTEYAKLVAEGDQASANLIKNHSPDAWWQEHLAIELVAARRDWAKNTSLEDDRAREKAELDRRAAERREVEIRARANELRVEAQARAEAALLEQARREFDGTTKKKETRAS